MPLHFKPTALWLAALCKEKVWTGGGWGFWTEMCARAAQINPLSLEKLLAVTFEALFWNEQPLPMQLPLILFKWSSKFLLIYTEVSKPSLRVQVRLSFDNFPCTLNDEHSNICCVINNIIQSQEKREKTNLADNLALHLPQWWVESRVSTFMATLFKFWRRCL